MYSIYQLHFHGVNRLLLCSPLHVNFSRTGYENYASVKSILVSANSSIELFSFLSFKNGQNTIKAFVGYVILHYSLCLLIRLKGKKPQH